MATVVVERSFVDATELADVQALEDAVAWCLEQHGVRFLRTFFSRDRRRMVCLYEAPDAEAVRHTQRTGELPFDRIWTAEVFDAPPAPSDPAAEHVVVERTFPEPLTDAMIDAFVAGESSCADLYRVTLVRSLVAPGRRQTVCLYRGPDAESVRTTSKSDGVPFDRAWTASLHEPPG